MKSTHYGKYVFTSVEQAKEKKAEFYNNEEVANFHTIVILGAEVLEEATYDENGDILTEAVYADNCLVDVIWRGLEPTNAEATALDPSVKPIYDHPTGWGDFSVDPSPPYHEVSGQCHQKDKI